MVIYDNDMKQLIDDCHTWDASSGTIFIKPLTLIDVNILRQSNVIFLRHSHRSKKMFLIMYAQGKRTWETYLLDIFMMKASGHEKRFSGGSWCCHIKKHVILPRVNQNPICCSGSWDGKEEGKETQVNLKMSRLMHRGDLKAGKALNIFDGSTSSFVSCKFHLNYKTIPDISIGIFSNQNPIQPNSILQKFLHLLDDFKGSNPKFFFHHKCPGENRRQIRVQLLQ